MPKSYTKKFEPELWTTVDSQLVGPVSVDNDSTVITVGCDSSGQGVIHFTHPSDTSNTREVKVNLGAGDELTIEAIKPIPDSVNEFLIAGKKRLNDVSELFTARIHANPSNESAQIKWYTIIENAPQEAKIIAIPNTEDRSYTLVITHHDTVYLQKNNLATPEQEIWRKRFTLNGNIHDVSHTNSKLVATTMSTNAKYYAWNNDGNMINTVDITSPYLLQNVAHQQLQNGHLIIFTTSETHGIIYRIDSQGQLLSEPTEFELPETLAQQSITLDMAETADGSVVTLSAVDEEQHARSWIIYIAATGKPLEEALTYQGNYFLNFPVEHITFDFNTNLTLISGNFGEVGTNGAMTTASLSGTTAPRTCAYFKQIEIKPGRPLHLGIVNAGYGQGTHQLTQRFGEGLTVPIQSILPVDSCRPPSTSASHTLWPTHSGTSTPMPSVSHTLWPTHSATNTPAPSVSRTLWSTHSATNTPAPSVSRTLWSTRSATSTPVPSVSHTLWPTRSATSIPVPSASNAFPAWGIILIILAVIAVLVGGYKKCRRWNEPRQWKSILIQIQQLSEQGDETTDIPLTVIEAAERTYRQLFNDNLLTTLAKTSGFTAQLRERFNQIKAILPNTTQPRKVTQTCLMIKAHLDVINKNIYDAQHLNTDAHTRLLAAPGGMPVRQPVAMSPRSSSQYGAIPLFSIQDMLSDFGNTSESEPEDSRPHNLSFASSTADTEHPPPQFWLPIWLIWQTGLAKQHQDESTDETNASIESHKTATSQSSHLFLLRQLGARSAKEYYSGKRHIERRRKLTEYRKAYKQSQKTAHQLAKLYPLLVGDARQSHPRKTLREYLQCRTELYRGFLSQWTSHSGNHSELDQIILAYGQHLFVSQILETTHQLLGVAVEGDIRLFTAFAHSLSRLGIKKILTGGIDYKHPTLKQGYPEGAVQYSVKQEYTGKDLLDLYEQSASTLITNVEPAEEEVCPKSIAQILSIKLGITIRIFGIEGCSFHEHTDGFHLQDDIFDPKNSEPKYVPSSEYNFTEGEKIVALVILGKHIHSVIFDKPPMSKPSQQIKKTQAAVKAQYLDIQPQDVLELLFHNTATKEELAHLGSTFKQLGNKPGSSASSTTASPFKFADLIISMVLGKSLKKAQLSITKLMNSNVSLPAWQTQHRDLLDRLQKRVDTFRQAIPHITQIAKDYNDTIQNLSKKPDNTYPLLHYLLQSFNARPHIDRLTSAKRRLAEKLTAFTRDLGQAVDELDKSLVQPVNEDKNTDPTTEEPGKHLDYPVKKLSREHAVFNQLAILLNSQYKKDNSCKKGYRKHDGYKEHKGLWVIFLFNHLSIFTVIQKHLPSLQQVTHHFQFQRFLLLILKHKEFFALPLTAQLEQCRKHKPTNITPVHPRKDFFTVLTNTLRQKAISYSEYDRLVKNVTSERPADNSELLRLTEIECQSGSLLDFLLNETPRAIKLWSIEKTLQIFLEYKFQAKEIFLETSFETVTSWIKDNSSFQWFGEFYQRVITDSAFRTSLRSLHTLQTRPTMRLETFFKNYYNSNSSDTDFIPLSLLTKITFGQQPREAMIIFVKGKNGKLLL